MAKTIAKKPILNGKPGRSLVNGAKKPKQPAAKVTLRVSKKVVAKAVSKTARSATKIVPAKQITTIRSVPKNTPKKVELSRPLKKVAVVAEKPSRRDSIKAVSHVPPARPAAAPQAENGKPRKSQAGFSARELEHFRDLLIAKRRELIGDMSAMELEALRIGGGSNLSNLPIHMADMGTDNYEQEFTLGLVQKDRDLLKEINLALGKIQSNSYGVCEGTGQPINKERLEYQPWVRYSVEHQRKIERHGR